MKPPNAGRKTTDPPDLRAGETDLRGIPSGDRVEEKSYAWPHAGLDIGDAMIQMPETRGQAENEGPGEARPLAPNELDGELRPAGSVGRTPTLRQSPHAIRRVKR